MAQKLEYSVSKPLNREAPISELISSYLTNGTSNYDRNHGPVPHLSSDTHLVRLTWDPSSSTNSVPIPLTLSIHDLATSFPQHSVICALACAGNRRHTMRTTMKEVQGIDWRDGAVMNCRWEGPRLRDVLRRAGVVDDDDENYPRKEGHWAEEDKGRKTKKRRHVQFGCHQTECQEDGWFGSSIELNRAMSVDAEVILALKMNDRPLPINKGFPVRVVVPGVIGARSVKWLDNITVSDFESPNFYQHRDYKVLPPEAIDAESAKKFWAVTPPMMDLPVNSVIGEPADGSTVQRNARGKVEVRGYAVPGGSRGPVVKVEVSADEGSSWTQAEIEEGRDGGKWSWVLWKVEIDVSAGTGRRLVCRARDRGGNEQPRRSQWNLRGVGYNGWGEVGGLEVV